MKRCLATFLVILFISVGFRDIVSVLYFYGNQEYIANNLCINRYQTEKMCSGKCYLDKLLDEDTSEENKIPTKELTEHLKLKLIPVNNTLKILAKPNIIKKPKWIFQSPFHQSDYLAGVFHPPDIVLNI